MALSHLMERPLDSPHPVIDTAALVNAFSLTYALPAQVASIIACFAVILSVVVDAVGVGVFYQRQGLGGYR